MAKTRGQKLMMWALFVLLTGLGFMLTFDGMAHHNDGATWEGGLFIGFGLAAFVAALTTRTKGRA